MLELEKYISSRYGITIIPSRKGGKIPKEGLSQANYTSLEFRRTGHSQCNEGALIILNQSVVVVDIDDRDLIPLWESLFPEFQQTVTVETQKGRHYYFEVPTHFMGIIKDGKRQLGPGVNVDFKTQNEGKCGGLISIPPSPNKSWVRSIIDCEMATLPQKLVEHYQNANTYNLKLSKLSNVSKHTCINMCTPDASEVSYADFSSASQCATGNPHADAASSSISRCLYAPNANYVDELLGMLSPTRAENYNDWIALGWTLHNIGDMYLSSWVAFSMQCTRKFKHGECEMLWLTMRGNGYNKSTLHRWAKEDDPVGYVAMRGKQITPFTLEHWQNHEMGLAQIAYNALKDTRKVVDKQVYSYDDADNVWLKEDNHIKISNALEYELQNVEAYYKAKHFCIGSSTEINEQQKKDIEKKIKLVQKELANIKFAGPIQRIAKLMNPLCSDPKFESLLDSKKHLLAVKNGVIELKTGLLRPRKHDDYIQTILDTSYNSDVSTNLIEDTIQSIMADDLGMLLYLQKLLGYGITGEACEELFFIFTAGGRNGKGLILSSIQSLMGKFFKDCNLALITKRNVGNVQAEKIALKSVRFALFNELNMDERLDTSQLKQFSGGDYINVRGLYKDAEDIKPMFTPILCTNHLPELDDTGKSIVDRLKVINFPVTFTDLKGGAPTVFVRQVDINLKDKLENNKEALLLWLVQGAVKWYRDQDLKSNAPPQVDEYSKKYIEGEDTLQMYINEECNVGPELKVSTSAFLDELNSFLGKKVYAAKLLSKMMLKKGFDNKLCRIQNFRGHCFIGLDFKENLGGDSL